MATSKKEEVRALDADERELVDKSYHPALQGLTDKELSSLLQLLRERRDKAQSQASQRSREIRGKGDPRGARPSQADEGSKLKASVLAHAVRRLNAEAERRRCMAARLTAADNARKALALKNAAGAERDDSFNSRTAHHGLRVIGNEKVRSLINPMERGRQRKVQAVSQARKDARSGA